MKNLEHEKRIVTENTRLATFRNGLALCAAIAVATASLTAQAAWTYDAEAKTLLDGNYSFPVKEVSIADPASATGEKISGLEISGDATAGSGDLDFTSVETDTGYKVISIVYWDHANILTNVTDCTRFIAPDLMQLGRASFQDYTALTEIVVSDKLTEIPYRCLNGTTGLTKITPETFPYVTKVGQGALQGSSIEAISLPNVKQIDGYAFQNFKGLVGDLSFPQLETAGDQAFYGATKITSVSAPKLNQTAASLFFECSELTNLVLGAGCTADGLKNKAYANCPKLENITPAPVIASVQTNPFVGETDTAYFKNNPFVMEGDAITELETCFMRQVPSLKSIEIRCDKLAKLGSYVFAAIADGAEILWDGAAPTEVHEWAFNGNSDVRKKIILKQADSADGWKSLSNFKAVSDSDKNRADYPGKSTLGVINGNVWLVKGWTSGLMILIR